VLRAQIWPGDINNNGIVNSVDLLYWAVAEGTQGPERTDASTDFTPQLLPGGWTQNFPGGLSYAYADCDGDGRVDEEDVDDAIEENFGLTHGIRLPDGFPAADPQRDPILRLIPDRSTVEEGETLRFDLQFEGSAVDSLVFYGLAVQLSYSRELFEEDADLEFEEEEDSWLSSDDVALQQLYVEDEDRGQVELALVRTGQQSTALRRERIGQFSIVIEDIIVGQSADDFELRIDSVYLIDEQLRPQAVVTDTARVALADQITSSQVGSPPAFRLFPNPTTGQLQLRGLSGLVQVQVLDPLGRVLMRAELPASTGALHHTLDLSALSSGTYLIAIKTMNYAFSRRLVIR